MLRRRLWIVCCNSILAALFAYGVYKDLSFAGKLGLIPPPLSQRLSQQLPDGILIIALLLGVVAELRAWRSSALINSLAYLGVAGIAIWGSFSLYGDPSFVLNLLIEAIPLFLLSVLNLWLYRKTWRRTVAPSG